MTSSGSGRTWLASVGLLVLGQDLDAHEQDAEQCSFSCYCETTGIYTRASVSSCPAACVAVLLSLPVGPLLDL